MYAHTNTFSHPLTVNPLIKGGNWCGGSANMVCCVIKVRVFVQLGSVPIVLIIQFSREMCPLTFAGSGSLIMSPGTGQHRRASAVRTFCLYTTAFFFCVCVCVLYAYKPKPKTGGFLISRCIFGAFNRHDQRLHAWVCKWHQHLALL